MRNRHGGVGLTIALVALVGMALEGCSKRKFRTGKGAVPQIVSVSPNSGPTSGGTAITITGAAFEAGAEVDVGGSAALTVIVISPGEITAMTPPGPLGPADVRVLNPTVQTTSVSAGAFTYVTGPGAPSPIILSVTPDQGPPSGGTDITVDGTDFMAGALLFVGGRPAMSVSVASTTEITGTTPAGPLGPVTVTVINPDLQAGVLPGGFTYTFSSVGIQVTSITPDTGSTDGDTYLTIGGQGFMPGATATIGGSPVASLGFVSSDELTGLTPAGPAGPADVVVTNQGGGSDTLAGGYTYVFAPLPTITDITPSFGETTGGTPVTVTGDQFIPGTVVNVGGVPLQNSSVDDINTITGETPPRAQPGLVDVEVANGNGSDVLIDGFTYIPVTGGAPFIISITPDSGPIGTRVVVDGINFAPSPAGNIMRLDGELAPVQTASDTQLVVYVPPKGRTGDFTVEVDTFLSNGVLFTVTSPRIFDIVPDSGDILDPVTLVGENFSPIAVENEVWFNGSLATVGAATTTQIDTWVPSDALAGEVWVEVNGDRSNSVFFCVQTLVDPEWPRNLSITPSIGPVGTTVTLTADYLSPNLSDNHVWFNGLRVPPLNVDSTGFPSVILTALVPPGATTGDVWVEVRGLYTVIPKTFTVTTPPPPPPTITRLSPEAGEQDSGLLIEGANFNPETYNNTVLVNGAWAEVVTASDTLLLARVPFTSSGLVTVEVAGQRSLGMPFTVFPKTGGPQTVEFFGRQIPAPRDRVVYVLDNSDSMLAPFGDFIDRFGNLVQGGNEWDLILDRTIQSVAELPQGFSFNIFAFSGADDPITGDCVPVSIPWQGSSQPASQTNKDAAILWLQGLVPAGKTGTAGVVADALSSDVQNQTLLLCTDGLWNCPPVSGAEQLCMMFNANTAGAAIHSFGIQTDGQFARILQAIAQLTGGTFTQIDP